MAELPRRNFDGTTNGIHEACMDRLELKYTTEEIIENLSAQPSYWNDKVQFILNAAKSSLCDLLKERWGPNQSYATFGLPLPPGTPIQNWDFQELEKKYQRLYNYLMKVRQHMPRETFRKMRKEIIKESTIILWIMDSEDGSNRTVVGWTPLTMLTIQSAENKVRRAFPKAQVRVLALNKENAAGLTATFVPSLVTQKLQTRENGKEWKQFGKLVEVDRQPKKGAKKRKPNENTEQTTDEEKAETDEQNTLPPISRKFPEKPDQNATEQTSDNESSFTLCASFPNMGVKVFHKANERTRNKLQLFYMQIECNLQFKEADHLPPLNYTAISHPFTVSDSQGYELIGHMLREFFSIPRYPGNQMEPAKCTFKWGVIKPVLRHLIQSQLPNARPLDDEEMLHIQCMMFLPKAKAEYQPHDPDLLERNWFAPSNKQNYVSMDRIKRIKYRLLRQFVYDDIEIEEEYLLKQNCYDLRDCKTQLNYNVIQWLCAAIDVIADRLPGRKICPDPKDNGKPQKSMMVELFNNRTITMSNKLREWKFYKMFNHTHPTRRAMLIRLCDWKLASLSIAYSNEDTALKPTYAAITANELREYQKDLPTNGGLVGLLMYGAYPSQFKRLVQFDGPEEVDRYGRRLRGARVKPKQRIFTGFVFDPQLQLLAPRDPFELFTPEFGPIPNRQLALTADDDIESSVIAGSGYSTLYRQAFLSDASRGQDIDEISDQLSVISLVSTSPSGISKL